MSTTMRTHAEFVERLTRIQKGEEIDEPEWWLRMSVQDYFIKWCECGVTQAEVMALLNAQSGAMKTLEVELEIRRGDWDNCDPTVIATSRGGAYAVIHRVYGAPGEHGG